MVFQARVVNRLIQRDATDRFEGSLVIMSSAMRTIRSGQSSSLLTRLLKIDWSSGFELEEQCDRSKSRRSDNSLTTPAKILIRADHSVPPSPATTSSGDFTQVNRIARCSQRSDPKASPRTHKTQPCLPANPQHGSSANRPNSSAHRRSRSRKRAQSAPSSNQSPNPAASMPRPPSPSSAPRTLPLSSAKSAPCPSAPAPWQSRRA